MRVRFWGVRGGLPVPGPQTVQVGGNTLCIEVRSSEGDLLILDAGSGLHSLGKHLLAGGAPRIVATVLISQARSDRTQGLPFFAPARVRGNRFVVFGQKGTRKALEALVAEVAGDAAGEYPPQAPRSGRADVLVKELKEAEPIVVGRSVVVRARRLGGQGSLAYRVSADGQAVAYLPDLRHPEEGFDAGALDLARDADLLIHDAHLTPEEREEYPDWPHSTWDEAARAALHAGARRLALFHFSPEACDEELLEVERQAQSVFAGAFLAREGLELDLATPVQAAEELDGGSPEGEDKVALRQAARRIVRKLKDEKAGG